MDSCFGYQLDTDKTVPTANLEGIYTTLTSDTNYKIWDLLTPSWLVIHWKDSQNALKAVILTLMVYYKERHRLTSADHRSL